MARGSLLLLIAALLPVRPAAAAELTASQPAAGGPGAAEPAAAETSDAYRFGEVIVVTGRSQGVQAAESVATVTAEEIQAKGARTLDQDLPLLPGVHVRGGGERPEAGHLGRGGPPHAVSGPDEGRGRQTPRQLLRERELDPSEQLPA